MRHAYQACTKHNRTYCQDSTCKAEEHEPETAKGIFGGDPIIDTMLLNTIITASTDGC